MQPLLYITHPEVDIDPQVPTPRWGLNAIGRARAERFAARGLLATGTRLAASTEQKAMDLAAILATACAGVVSHDEAFDENDRSSTGFLAGDGFAEAVRELFGKPEVSYRGWETAAAAQSRIVAAVKRKLAELPQDTHVAFCGHGCVGTLLKCALGNRPVALSEDQRLMAAPGGGNIFAFSRDLRLLSDWRAMEDFSA
ncbi:MAG TPA: histidine phosphatase family protein [Devosiaceae bacterium]|jgi:broad specificity phosphatase PhoE